METRLVETGRSNMNGARQRPNCPVTTRFTKVVVSSKGAGGCCQPLLNPRLRANKISCLRGIFLLFLIVISARWFAVEKCRTDRDQER